MRAYPTETAAIQCNLRWPEGETSTGKLKIGTSGWHYKHWVGDFYPPKFPSSKMLSWYAQHFHTVEINNSFYRLPAEETLRKWSDTVPADFCFSVKASRFITHIKRLSDPENAVERFLSRANALNGKLGPILFQLPPHWHVNVERLESFVSALPRGQRFVLELRDLSWYVPAVYVLLQRHNVALCLHDWHAAQWPITLTADFTYIRLHGTSGHYAGNYTRQMLQGWADRIRDWEPSLNQIFVYFNNDVGGNAIRNAKTLGALLGKESSERVA